MTKTLGQYQNGHPRQEANPILLYIEQHDNDVPPGDLARALDLHRNTVKKRLSLLESLDRVRVTRQTCHTTFYDTTEPLVLL